MMSWLQSSRAEHRASSRSRAAPVTASHRRARLAVLQIDREVPRVAGDLQGLELEGLRTGVLERELERAVGAGAQRLGPQVERGSGRDGGGSSREEVARDHQEGQARQVVVGDRHHVSAGALDLYSDGGILED